MLYQFYDVDSQLKPFVKTICSIEKDASMVSQQLIRVLPDACVELFFNIREPQQVLMPDGRFGTSEKSFITSRLNQFMDVRTEHQVTFVSVCFSRGQAYRFFSVSMHDIANQVIALRDVWGYYADELQERIEWADTMIERVGIIQQYLICQLHQSTSFDPAIPFCIAQLSQANGLLSLEELACRVGISNRQLIRRFNQCVGVSPKEFARITTFNHALKLLNKYPTDNLTKIAYESGYYDQAHFIRACREYAGLTPTQLLTIDNVLY